MFKLTIALDVPPTTRLVGSRTTETKGPTGVGVGVVVVGVGDGVTVVVGVGDGVVVVVGVGVGVEVCASRMVKL